MIARIYLVLFVALLFVSCREEIPIAEDDTVTIAISKEISRIHPIIHPSSIAREVYQYIFLPLADVDPDTYEITPLLIKELAKVSTCSSNTYKGMTCYTMEILDEAVWDDGVPITGHDYAFTIKSIKHPMTDAALYRSATRPIVDVEVNRDNPKLFTVIVDAVELLTEEMVETMYLYPKHIYDPNGILDSISLPALRDNKEYSNLKRTHPALDSFALAYNGLKFGRTRISGAGPYRLKSWSDDNRILLERKEDYWASGKDVFAFKAYPRFIEVVLIPDPITITTLLKEGGIDATNALTTNYFEDLKNDAEYRDEFTFLTPELTKFYFVALNNRSARLRSPMVRKALAHLTDVSNIIEVLENGLGRQTTGIFHPRKEYYQRNLKSIPYDIDKGIAILKAEGWEDTNGDGTRDKKVDGVHTELLMDFYITGSEFSKNLALLLKADFSKAGVGVQITTKPYSEIRRDHLKKRAYDMTVLALPQSITLDDPYLKWHSDSDTPSGGNYVSYRSEKADSLIEQIRENDEPDMQKTYYHSLQNLMYDDMPVLFLYNPIERIVVSRRWKSTATSRRPGYLANTFEPQSAQE